MAARFVQWPRPCPIAVGSSSDRPIAVGCRPTAYVQRGQSGQFGQRPPSTPERDGGCVPRGPGWSLVTGRGLCRAGGGGSGGRGACSGPRRSPDSRENRRRNTSDNSIARGFRDASPRQDDLEQSTPHCGRGVKHREGQSRARRRLRRCPGRLLSSRPTTRFLSTSSSWASARRAGSRASRPAMSSTTTTTKGRTRVAGRRHGRVASTSRSGAATPRPPARPAPPQPQTRRPATSTVRDRGHAWPARRGARSACCSNTIVLTTRMSDGSQLRSRGAIGERSVACEATDPSPQGRPRRAHVRRNRPATRATENRS